jgi:hypothetical protein
MKHQARIDDVERCGRQVHVFHVHDLKFPRRTGFVRVPQQRVRNIDTQHRQWVGNAAHEGFESSG